jgi:hypothetical protein
MRSSECTVYRIFVRIRLLRQNAYTLREIISRIPSMYGYYEGPHFAPSAVLIPTLALLLPNDTR